MIEPIEDLSRFFDDRCWMCVLLARQAKIGVILRRGPTDWWRVTLLNTKRDTFEGGQWLRGRLYPEKCDLSPNGKLLIYFCGKWKPRNIDAGYGETWTAVSRPPYLTALTLWPIGHTGGGSGVFIDDQTVSVGASSPRHHPDHPLGPLKLWDDRQDGDLPQPSWNYGWQRAPPASVRQSSSVKSSGNLLLGRGTSAEQFTASGSRKLYTIYGANAYPDPLASFQAHWADWDQNGRLVATVGGRVLASKVTKKKNTLQWRQLAALHEEKPSRMEAPDWAQHW
jgi:hypothetical protein